MKTHTPRTPKFDRTAPKPDTQPRKNAQQVVPPGYGLDFADQSSPVQSVTESGAPASAIAAGPVNNTGLPDQLKAGVEALSGYSLDDVKVHYHSAKPAQLNALAYAQGTDIHIGPGQEQHLPHETWHVAQQKAGRVRPTGRLNGVPLNDDPKLEMEADAMGAKALQKSNFEFPAPHSISNSKLCCPKKETSSEYPLMGASSEDIIGPTRANPVQTERSHTMANPQQAEHLDDKKLSPEKSILSRKRKSLTDDEVAKYNQYRKKQTNDKNAVDNKMLSETYDKSEKKGKELLGVHEKGWPEKPGIKKAEGESSKIQIIDKYYTYAWFLNGNSVTILLVRKSMNPKWTSGNQLKVGQSWEVDPENELYRNEFNPETGEYTALQNRKDSDFEEAAKLEKDGVEGEEKVANNSEIIRFTKAKAIEFVQSSKTESTDTDKTVSLNSITRDNIVNTETLDTIYMCNGGQSTQVDLKNSITIKDLKMDDAAALLGTPNGRSAVWILKEEKNIEINEIIYFKNKLIVKYKQKS